MARARRPPVAPPAGGAGSTPLRPPPLSTNINVIDTRPAPRNRTGWRKWTGLQWKATTTDPAIGNGTLSGWIKFDDRWLEVWVEVVMGSTTTFGTGSWYFAGRPVVVATPMSPLPAVGYAGFRDDSTSTNYVGNVGLGVSTGFVPRLLDHSAADGTVVNLSSSVPFTWATDDTLSLYAKFRYTN